MPDCFAVDCNHGSIRNPCKMFRFPPDTKKFKQWETACRRQDRKPTREDRLCSCHFIDRMKENGPSKFAWNDKKLFAFSSPEKRTRKKTVHAEPAAEPAVYEATEPSEVGEHQPVQHNRPGSSAQCGSCVVLAAENYFLADANKKAADASAYVTGRFTLSQIWQDKELVYFYTGLPTSSFSFLLSCLQKAELQYACGWNVTKLKLEDQLLLALYKLRHNPMHMDLAVRFGLSERCVTNVFRTILGALHQLLSALHSGGIPSVEKNQTSLPECFQRFPRARVILDCTEIECDVTRQDMAEQRQSFSNYKQRNTFKALVGVAPNGAVVFVSDLFLGSASDKEITSRSGLLEQLKPGDLIVADKGFTIQNILPEGVHLNIPPRLMNPQFTPSENRLTTDIARARIHVERAIERIKGYRILRHVPQHMKPSITTIFQTCCWLVNLQCPLISETKGTLQ